MHNYTRIMYIFSLAICKELVYIYSKVIIQGF